MLKKIKDKRIEQFKADFPDFQVSKKTNSLYCRIGVTESTKQTKHTGRAVTKNTIKKIGQIHEWKVSTARFVYLLTVGGRLMVSKQGGNFKGVGLKQIRQENGDLSNVFFIGKKYEWIKNYPNLYPYRLFQGFNSLSEAKKFLGFSFISDDDFTNLFGEDHYDCLTPMILAKEKKNVVRLYKGLDSDTKDMLSDYINLCQDNNIEIEIPAGKNRLEELHTYAVWEVNKKTADCYSKEKKYEVSEEFTKVWKERGLEFKRLETPYEMYAQGIKQQHCIGTNYAKSLHRNVFYTFNYDNKSYEIQIYDNGGVGQFYGKRNTQVPNELRAKVTKEINLKFTLKDIQPDLEDYPMLKGTVEESIWTF